MRSTMAGFHFMCILILPLIQSVLRLDCVTPVKSCPCSKELWEERSSIVNCSELKYTCMLTSDDTLAEACIYDYPIRPDSIGCPYIQTCLESFPSISIESEFKKCNASSGGCPPSNHSGYSLTKLYQFSECIQNDGSKSCENMNHPAISMSDNGDNVVLLGILVPTLVFLPIVVLMILIIKRRYRLRNPALPVENNEQIEDENILLPEDPSPMMNTVLADMRHRYPSTYFGIYRKSENLQQKVIIGYDVALPENRAIFLKQNGVDIIRKNPYFIREEERTKYEHHLEDYVENMEKFSTIINTNAPDLWRNHSNLTIISASNFKITGGNCVRKPCIVLYCLSKGYIPNDENPFPQELISGSERLQTDVREGYFVLGPTNKWGRVECYNDPICMGSSIGSEARDAGGSIGLFVDLDGHKKGFITCCHVIFDCISPAAFSFEKNVYEVPYRVVQPWENAFCGKSNTICGEVVKAIFCTDSSVGIDVAIVEITNRMPSSGHFVIRNMSQATNIGYEKGEFPSFSTGKVCRKINKEDIEKTLLKSGASSGLTRSLFKLDGLQVRIFEEGVWMHVKHGRPIVMKQQYETEAGPIHSPFFLQGDSGSAVFKRELDGSLTCIGIAIGVTSYGTTVITPIGEVLDALGLTDSDVTKFDE